MGTFGRKPITMTGVDMLFVLTLTLVLLSVLMFVVVIRKLLRQRAVASLDLARGE